jgi:hypothetical protein
MTSAARHFSYTGKVALAHRLLAYTVVPSETTRPVAG